MSNRRGCLRSRTTSAARTGEPQPAAAVPRSSGILRCFKRPSLNARPSMTSYSGSTTRCLASPRGSVTPFSCASGTASPIARSPSSSERRRRLSRCCYSGLGARSQPNFGVSRGCVGRRPRPDSGSFCRTSRSRSAVRLWPSWLPWGQLSWRCRQAVSRRTIMCATRGRNSRQASPLRPGGLPLTRCPVAASARRVHREQTAFAEANAAAPQRHVAPGRGSQSTRLEAPTEARRRRPRNETRRRRRLQLPQMQLGTHLRGPTRRRPETPQARRIRQSRRRRRQHQPYRSRRHPRLRLCRKRPLRRFRACPTFLRCRRFRRHRRYLRRPRCRKRRSASRATVTALNASHHHHSFE
jgi:hypothetical protein